MGRNYKKRVRHTLGQSLLNASKSEKRKSRAANRRTLEEAPLSITQTSNLDDFLATAQMAGRDFAKKIDDSEAEVIVFGENVVNPDPTSREFVCAPIPRRPPWTSETTHEELDKTEKSTFLEWRRYVAQMTEENSSLAVSPFEKNINVWRQLWRVVERSNLVVQLLDARNPLPFLSEDLKTYVCESGKSFMLLLSKADFVPLQMRLSWAKYFSTRGLDFIYFSAKAIIEPLHLNTEEEQINENEEEKLSYDNDLQAFAEKARICNRDDLLDSFHSYYKKDTPPSTGFCVGFVGYPNVGKSSTMNILFKEKKTAVSATPGKTKHFQTLQIDDCSFPLQICDCPGLIFPSFAFSKAHLMCDGILSIDNIRDFVEPIRLLCQRICLGQFVSLYGSAFWMNHLHPLVFPSSLVPPTFPPHHSYMQRTLQPHDLLAAFASFKGFFAAKGAPDESRAARILLKELVNGRLLYISPPPDSSPQEIELFKISACLPGHSSHVLVEDNIVDEMKHWLSFEQKIDDEPAPSRASLKGTSKASRRNRKAFKKKLQLEYLEKKQKKQI